MSRGRKRLLNIANFTDKNVACLERGSGHRGEKMSLNDFRNPVRRQLKHV